jgi:hypothetical protein
MAKTPARIVELMIQQQEMMRHVTEVLRIKRDFPDYQSNVIRDKSTDYYIGLADGCNAMLENALMAHKCYAGFQHQRATPTKIGEESFYESCGLDHPEFAEWRRSYYTKG